MITSAAESKLVKPSSWAWKASEVDSPFARFATFLLPFWELQTRDVITGARPDITDLTALTFVATRVGRAVHADGTTGRLAWTKGLDWGFQAGGPWTAVVVTRLHTSISHDENNIFSFDVDGGSTVNRGARIATVKTGGDQGKLRLASQQNNEILVGTTALSLGPWYAITLSANNDAPGNQWFMSHANLDTGSVVDFRDQGGSGSDGDATNIDVGGASFNTTNDMPQSETAMFAYLDGIDVKGPELRSLLLDPFQLIRPKILPLRYLPVAGAVTSKNYYGGGFANARRLTRGFGWAS